MFGYVLPLQGELKVREFEQFQAAYCGLCHTLGRKYGYAARFVLNYDFTFLAMLLSAGEKEVQYEYHRCTASPFRRRRCCTGGLPFQRAAGYSVILAYWKLQDDRSDEGWIKTILPRVQAAFLKRSYRKAARDFPAFDAAVRERLDELSALEKAGCGSLDLTADKFACILKAAVCDCGGEDVKRVMEQLLYHAGRWIYIVDACDDLERDRREGAYNPLLRRFDLQSGALGEKDSVDLKITLSHSVKLVSSAYELLDAGVWRGILENIIYLGFPWVTDMVLAGKWEKGRVSHKRGEL